MMKTVGIVLAGGLSRRFGSPKAFARIGNEYFYELAIEALEPHCEEVIVVTRPELLERFPARCERDDRYTGSCRTRSACRNFVGDGICGSGPLYRSCHVICLMWMMRLLGS